MSGYVYVSYGRADAAYVTALVAHLASRGVTAFADPEPDSPERWQQVTRPRIDESDAVVVVMSPASAASAGVGQDVRYAGELRKPVAPLLLAGPGFPQLAGLPVENVSDGRLPRPEFVATLWALGQPPPAVPPPAVVPTKRSRAGLWVGLGAAAVVLVLLGVAFLISR